MSLYFRLQTQFMNIISHFGSAWGEMGPWNDTSSINVPFRLARNQLLTIHVEMSKSYYPQKLTQKCENCKNPHQYPKLTWNIGYQVFKPDILCHRLSKIHCPTLSFAFARGPRFGHGITSEGPAKWWSSNGYNGVQWGRLFPDKAM